MKIEPDWAKRRWLDFRQGHNLYLAFALSLMNFVVIAYVLALERVPLLNQLFPTIWTWIIFFITVYIPLAIILGHFHKKQQLATDQSELALHNPVTMFQMRRFDDISEAIEKICQRLDIQDISIPKWKDSGNDQSKVETRGLAKRKVINIDK